MCYNHEVQCKSVANMFSTVVVYRMNALYDKKESSKRNVFENSLTHHFFRTFCVQGSFLLNLPLESLLF